MEIKNKNFGLDVARAIAILLVLIAHIAPAFDSSPFLYNVFYHAGLYGVELFFVLSGYLIGQILFTKLAPHLTYEEIKIFYFRRWLRTLPLYYVVLSTLIIISLLSQTEVNLHISHFFFLQNFNPIEASFFGVAWSLSVEEWFYLLLPILFYFVQKKGGIKNITNIIITAILTILIIRFVYVLLLQPTFDLGVRKFIPLRFDSLFIGVLLAQIKIEYYFLYRKMYVTTFALIALVLLLIYYLWYVNTMLIQGITYFDSSLLIRVFSWPLLSIFMGILIIYLENSTFINTKISTSPLFYRFFTYLSIYSYSIYLIHFDIYSFFHTYVSFHNLFLDITIPTLCILFISLLIYRYFESPILHMRDNVFIHTIKSNKK